MLEIKNLKVEYLSRGGRGTAVEDVNLTIKKGRILGLVGESGSGKSTLGWSILKLLPRTARIVDGEILFEGKNLLTFSEKKMNNDIRGNRVSMIIQNPHQSLNPVFTISSQICDILFFHKNKSHGDMGLVERSYKKNVNKACDILDKMGIADVKKRIGEYPHQFSGGMKQRVMMAMAFITNPDLLIADEPTTALDATIEAQILELLKNTVRKVKTSVLYITHNLGIVSELADNTAVMYAGSIVEEGKTSELLNNPMHPYTEALLNCLPGRQDRKQSLFEIGGAVPSIFSLPTGCKFHPRCHYRKENCTKARPLLAKQGSERFVACHYPIT
jgi:peptide/nickel transport system ATP-binding protein